MELTLTDEAIVVVTENDAGIVWAAMSAVVKLAIAVDLLASE